MRKQSETAIDFWDTVFDTDVRGPNGEIQLSIDPADPNLPALEAAATYFGDLSGKRLLDLGCGSGRFSLYFAERGANVVAVDRSQPAIERLREFCSLNQVHNVEPMCADAFDIAKVGQFDFVYGSMILHHIEPFSLFVPVLRSTLRAGGRAFFFENSSNSGLLIWFRDHIVGRFGVPKYGDNEEAPLSAGEIEQLRKFFNVRVEYPELYFFRLASVYLLRERGMRLFAHLDRAAFRLKPLRRWSYRQFLYVDG